MKAESVIVLSAAGNPTGSIGFSDIPVLMRQADRFISSGLLDLSGVQRVDSAGLAFFLELTRRARKHNQAFKLAGANSQIRSIVSFFGLDSILNFADGDNPHEAFAAA